MSKEALPTSENVFVQLVEENRANEGFEDAMTLLPESCGLTEAADGWGEELSDVALGVVAAGRERFDREIVEMLGES